MGDWGSYWRNGTYAVLSTAIVLAWGPSAQAHTISIGYEGSGPGAATFWFGTYHAGVGYTEGSMQLVGSSYSATVAFTLLTLTKPAGLIDGTTNFYSNGTSLVGSFAASAYVGLGPAAAWQGASFTGLRSGTYTFTYLPIAVPTSVWRPEDAAILSYTVNLSGALIGGTQLSPFAANANQRSIAGTLDTAIAAGASNPGLTALGTMSAGQIANALTQISGETASDAAIASGEMIKPFLSLMIDSGPRQLGDGATSDVSGRPIPFAQEQSAMAPSIAQAYAALGKVVSARAVPQSSWHVWGSAFGGGTQVGGNADVGSHDAALRAGGVATGFDYRVSPATIVGFALAGGATSWGLSNGLGGGRSDVFQAGAYASTALGAGYLSGSLAAGLHGMSTNRTIDVAGPTRLTASFDAVNYGGRIEGGYRFATPVMGVIPYAAVQSYAYHSPSYREASSTGVNDFALSYSSSNSTETRTELGSRFDRAFLLPGDQTLVLRGRTGWAHNWLSGTSMNGVFQSFPAPGFLVTGAQIASDSGLVSAAADLRFINGVSVGIKFDGEFAPTQQTYAGSATLRYRW